MGASKKRIASIFGSRGKVPVSAGVAILLLMLRNIPLLIGGYSPATDSWAWSELHINYAGGFVRRGLLGEVAYQLQSFFGLTTTAFFGTVFLFLTVIFILLLFWLLRPFWSRPFVVWIVLFSPALVLFPIFDSAAALRKDIFVSVGFLMHGLLVQAVRHGRLTPWRYQRLLITGLAPYLMVAILIHEVQWFFLPIHAIFPIFALGLHHGRFPRAILAMAPALLMGPLLLAFQGDAQIVTAICDSWRGRAEVNCSDWSGIGAIAWSLTQSTALVKSVFASSNSMKLWIIAASLSAIPALVLVWTLKRQIQLLKLIGIFLGSMLPALPLFFLGWDWGRWLNLQAMSAVSLLLSLVPARFTYSNQRSKRVTALLVVSTALYLFVWYLPHSGLPSTIIRAHPKLERVTRQLRLTYFTDLQPR